MIANARMYGVSPEVDLLWRELLCAIIDLAGLDVDVIDHAAPAPLEDLWNRPDIAAVFMCGLPFSRQTPQPVLVAAPVPSPAGFGDEARYWSEFVVRSDSLFRTVADTFGSRIAFTVPGSQSGCVAALSHFASLKAHVEGPLFAEIVAPTITPRGALEAVVSGTAEIAPIDSYAFSLLRAHRPDLTARVRVVGRTLATPIPPLVASPSPTASGADAIASALMAAHLNPTLKPLMDRLLLRRFVRPDTADYDVLRERFATATQCWRARALAAVTHPAFAG
jgi:ABC-type phosphate/phosphonate transport system substrate-binding protein